MATKRHKMHKNPFSSPFPFADARTATQHPTAKTLLCLLSLFVATPPFFAAEPDRDSPEAELASFKLPPGFEVNLWASERDGIVKPVQIRWDARGRLWAIGTTTYPQLKPGETPNDKVWILEDTKHAGHADKVTVFADGLMIPTGLEIAPTHGKESACYVGESPKLWLMTDTDGDGKADKKEVVLRGFGTGDNHQNINSFRWSPGGELMFSQGLHGHARVETPYGVVGLDEAGLWRYRPDEQRLDAFFGGSADPQNPWGWTFLHWGQPLLSAGNSGNMYFALPEMIRGYQGGRRDTIWAEGRGRKTSNPELLESSQFPDEWQNAIITGGYINNAVWTLHVEQDGAGFKISDDPKLPPLIQSTQGSFRPVDVKLGPDGALYICDWYNPIIGHYQASFRHPDRDKTHGRIWRVTYKGRPLLTPPPIADAPIEHLLENLHSPEKYVREQSKRELAGRPTKEVISAVRSWWPRLEPGHPDTEHALYEALGVCEWHESPQPELLQRVLASKAPEARAYAASTLARWADRLPPQFDVVEKLADLAHDEDPRVRLAAIVAAGNIPRPESMVVVLSAATQPRDKFINTALVAATAALKPQWEPVVAKGAPDWKPEWYALLKTLDKPKPKPAPAKKVTQLVSAPIVPIYGRVRASPYILGTIAADVTKNGNPKHGEEVFHRPEIACISCHHVGDKGGNIGPALDAIGSAQPLEFIIGAVLEPQREVKESFETYRITTKKGEELIGIIVAGNDSELTLRDPAGMEHTVAQADIAKREFIGSLMPAGLTDNLSPEDLRDLFAYLSQLGKAK
ncbi:membrane-bound dehydrogenase domain protein [Chthoniobacter flavus Ellin428]|uniref:Membrane-bound dehydrogenase domain protein n=1 Tax=Chthoniobacter flavus Ellin428 TaxID=497964 RepID=B4D3Z1_9BACT|nr:membrane-bound dehydrogenase domain protein [Chthoniobacter flavus Ellin428]TCO93555.1 putative membrane-bound dehydrogenase-like protein [Chthoniobacter flavus]